jgi:isoleucyl-tRNA synthetase
MSLAREVVSLGLEARVVAGLKVRQPLESVLVSGPKNKIEKLDNEYLEIIGDELNVKEVVVDSGKIDYSLFEEYSEDRNKEQEDQLRVYLNKNISPELAEEGDFREFLRQVQIMRKNNGLKVADRIELKIDLMDLENKNFIDNYLDELLDVAGVTKVNYGEINDNDSVKINGKEIKILLLK